MIADQHVVGTFGQSGSNISARSRTAGKSNIISASTKARTLPTAQTRSAPSAHLPELKSLVGEFGERVVARQIGVSRNTLRRILSGGNRSPSRRMLRQIAAATHALSANGLTDSPRPPAFASSRKRKRGRSDLPSLPDGSARTLPTCEKQSTGRESLGWNCNGQRGDIVPSTPSRWLASGTLPQQTCRPPTVAHEMTNDNRSP